MLDSLGEPPLAIAHQDEETAGDLRRIASRDLSPRTRELGARNEACPLAPGETRIEREIRVHPWSIRRMLGHEYEHGRAKSPPCRATGTKLCRETAVQCPVNSPRTRLVAEVSSPARAGYHSKVLFLEGSRLRRNVDGKQCEASTNMDLCMKGLCPERCLCRL